MTLESRIELIKAVHQKTVEEKLNWEVGPTSNSFYVKIGENAISVREIKDDYIIQLFNSDGEIVEEVADPEFSAAGYSTAFTLLRELFSMAKRNAYGSDRVVSNILSDLNNI
ncbi:hypothetical protein HFO68_29305 [Rhizobium laguerreae]|uniref:hypothetical protein n=1 Tax=Rhizobium TaxID=379 RepID=UPI00143F5339|nr:MULTISPECIES: hypothetical protein [Rhizobium]MBN9983820.1 hypothetical protein [Rhizobium laguerreae]MBY3072343.1 hypothetical protein [Rhizobium laguerreae]MBY3100905.1 hypothetical protein [Rhizobium laguerreae]MBY3108623.1 hypothetical protein [Rhizobium laguerreae]MBY3161591.1 hypothetical protein [Rhizobium laguerreae]